MKVMGVAMSLYGPRERARKRAAAKQSPTSNTSGANNITNCSEPKSHGSNTNPRYLKRNGEVLIQNGFNIIPIIAGKKYSGLKGWQDTNATPAMVESWLENGHADSGIGILTKNNPAIDFDIRDQEIAKKDDRFCH